MEFNPNGKILFHTPKEEEELPTHFHKQHITSKKKDFELNLAQRYRKHHNLITKTHSCSILTIPTFYIEIDNMKHRKYMST